MDEAGTTVGLQLDALVKGEFLRSKGLSKQQIKTIAELDDIQIIEFAQIVALRSDFSPLIKDALHEMAIHAKTIMQKPFATASPSEIPNFIEDLKTLINNPNLQNIREVKDWLKDFKGKSDSGLELELQRALSIANQGKSVRLGYNPTDASGNIILVNGNPIDIDVYNVVDDVFIECKRTNNKWKTRLGDIGLKFNKETKLPASIRDAPGRKLHGEIHVKDSSFFNGLATDRDDVLYKILEFVQNTDPVWADKITGINRLHKLHVKVGNDLEFTFLRTEW